MGPPAKISSTTGSPKRKLINDKGITANCVKISYGATMVELLSSISAFLREFVSPEKGTSEQNNIDLKDKVNKRNRIKEKLMFFHSIYKDINERRDDVPISLNQCRNPEKKQFPTNSIAAKASQQTQGIDPTNLVSSTPATRMGLACGFPKTNSAATAQGSCALTNLNISQRTNPLEDTETYFSSMSDLLAIYIDLEVVTCLEDSLEPEMEKKSERRQQEEKDRRIKGAMSRILSSLYTLLDKSEDHILDTILKLRPPFNEDPNKETYHSIYASIYRCVAKRAAKRQIKDLTYVRYVLVYKLLDNIAKDEEREDVIKQAATHLRPPPGFLKRRKTLPRVLPTPTEETNNLTEFYLRKRYNVWKKAKELLEATSQAAHKSIMFPSFKSDAQLLNPKIRDAPQPYVSPNGRLEQITTVQSAIDDLWVRLRCEESVSETSVLHDVTFFKKPRKLSITKMYKVLNRHHLRSKTRINNNVKTDPSSSECSENTKRRMENCNSGSGDILIEASGQSSEKRLASKSVGSPESHVMKKPKIEKWELENHSDSCKKEYSIPSLAVPPFIANVSEPTCSNMVLSMKEKPLMVDASVSTIDDFDCSFFKSSLDFKHDQSLLQSSSSLLDKQLFPISDTQSIFDKTPNCLMFLPVKDDTLLTKSEEIDTDLLVHEWFSV